MGGTGSHGHSHSSMHLPPLKDPRPAKPQQEALVQHWSTKEADCHRFIVLVISAEAPRCSWSIDWWMQQLHVCLQALMQLRRAHHMTGSEPIGTSGVTWSRIMLTSRASTLQTLLAATQLSAILRMHQSLTRVTCRPHIPQACPDTGAFRGEYACFSFTLCFFSITLLQPHRSGLLQRHGSGPRPVALCATVRH